MHEAGSRSNIMPKIITSCANKNILKFAYLIEQLYFNVIITANSIHFMLLLIELEKIVRSYQYNYNLP